jgi:hypothetical protein
LNSLYDALIIVGHAKDQPFATRLSQWLQEFGYQVVCLADQPEELELGELGQMVSHAHNLLIVATPQGYSLQTAQVIGQAVAYHKRLFLLHPCSEERDSRSTRPTPEAKTEAWQALTALIKAYYPGQKHLWLSQIDLQVEDAIASPSLKRLIALLQDQEFQVHQHTYTLVQALTWEQYQRSPSALLMEPALTHAIRWLNQLADGPTPTCQPTPLQVEFIAQSTHWADQSSATVFLAYAEGDLDLPLTPSGPSGVAAIRHLLQKAGLTLWDRYYDYPPAENLETAISRATEACDNYVILLSPNAIHDTACLQGLLFALSMNKRIVPVLLTPVAAEHLPDPLQAMAWIDLGGATYPLTESPIGQQLLDSLSDQTHYHRTHTRLLMAALRWERQQRHPSGLLDKGEARAYQRWLTVARQQPRYRPIYLQELFVAESLRHPAVASSRDWRPSASQGMAQMKSWLKQVSRSLGD